MRSSNGALVAATAMIALCGVGIWSLQARAKGTGPDTGDRVIPYSGFLERDGVPVAAAAVPMTFTITDGANSWAYDASVDVFAGRFSVMIGAQAATPLPEWIFAAESVEVRIDIDGVALSGGQRIVPLPYAYWAAESDNLTVTNDLSVGGSAQVAGGLSVQQGAQVSGDVTLQQDLAVQGTLDIGLTRKECIPTSGTGSCTCDAGLKAIAGGVDCATVVGYYHSAMHVSAPLGDTGWQGICLNQSAGLYLTADKVWVICARVQ